MKMVFVFGSNDLGLHGAGAARFALDNLNMPRGKSYGHYGECFAIPTKDLDIETLPIERIKMYVDGFIAYAMGHPKINFKITRIGCGLAGLKDEDIAPLFTNAPIKNCYIDEVWSQFLPNHKTWGTF